VPEALDRFEAEYRKAVDDGNVPAIAAASREIRYWKARRASAEVVKPADRSRASFGTVVTLRRSDGREQRFRIVRTRPIPRGTLPHKVQCTWNSARKSDLDIDRPRGFRFSV
jgi:transcription elongation GreA/GreB family factor